MYSEIIKAVTYQPADAVKKVNVLVQYRVGLSGFPGLQAKTYQFVY